MQPFADPALSTSPSACERWMRSSWQQSLSLARWMLLGSSTAAAFADSQQVVDERVLESWLWQSGAPERRLVHLAVQPSQGGCCGTDEMCVAAQIAEQEWQRTLVHFPPQCAATTRSSQSERTYAQPFVLSIVEEPKLQIAVPAQSLQGREFLQQFFLQQCSSPGT